MRIDGINLVEGSEVTNLTVKTGTDFPSLPNAGELFYKIGEGLHVHDGTTWSLIQGTSQIGGETAQEILDKLVTVDGTGSGLDADLLDGYNSDTANTANTIVRRDASGDFSANVITADLTGTSSNSSALETHSYTDIINEAISNSITFSIALG